MNWEKPEWYLTPQEFADLVVQSLETTNHFRRNEPAHPEDLVIAFVTQAESIAIGAGAAGKKIWAKKKGVMETGNLRKHALPLDDEIDPVLENELEYSEYRHKNAYL